MQIIKKWFKIPKKESLQYNYPNQIIHIDLTDLPKEFLSNIKDSQNYKDIKKSKLTVIIDNLFKYAFCRNYLKYIRNKSFACSNKIYRCIRKTSNNIKG